MKNKTKHITESGKFTVDISDSGKFTVNIQDCRNFTVNISDCRNYSINRQDCVVGVKRKPAWFPIQDLPEEREVAFDDRSMWAERRRGYNACIEDILKKTDCKNGL